MPGITLIEVQTLAAVDVCRKGLRTNGKPRIQKKISDTMLQNNKKTRSFKISERVKHRSCICLLCGFEFLLIDISLPLLQAILYNCQPHLLLAFSLFGASGSASCAYFKAVLYNHSLAE